MFTAEPYTWQQVRWQQITKTKEEATRTLKEEGILCFVFLSALRSIHPFRKYSLQIFKAANFKKKLYALQLT